MPNVAALSGTLGLETSPFVAGVNRAIASTLQMDKGMRTMATSMRLSASAADLFGGSMGAMNNHIAMGVSHIGMLLRDVKHLGSSFKSLLAATGIGAGILAFSFVVSKISDAFAESKKRAEDFKETMVGLHKIISDMSKAGNAGAISSAGIGAAILGSNSGTQTAERMNAIREKSNELLTEELKIRNEIVKLDERIAKLAPIMQGVEKFRGHFIKRDPAGGLFDPAIGRYSRVLGMKGTAKEFENLGEEKTLRLAAAEALKVEQDRLADEQKRLAAAESWRKTQAKATARFQDDLRQRKERDEMLSRYMNDSELLRFSNRSAKMSENRVAVEKSISEFRKNSPLSMFAEMQADRLKKSKSRAETIGESGSIGFREFDSGLPSSTTFGAQRFNALQRTEETLDESKVIQAQQLQELKKIAAGLTLQN